MRYEIKGTPLPVVICYLQNGERRITEAGAMSCMSPNLTMETSGGGVGKVFGRMFSGESLFLNQYTANGDAMNAFASSFPGSIIPFEIAPGKEIVVQKSGFLAAESGVELSVHFQQKMGAGFFGGEGFIMQRLAGQGMAFVEIDGSVIEYELAPGQQMVLDTGYLAAMEMSCSISVQSVAGFKNKMLGGEGFFNTVVTGPGKIWVQSMPASSLAGVIRPFIGNN